MEGGRNKFEFYPDTKEGAVKAMHGRTLNLVTHEVIDTNNVAISLNDPLLSQKSVFVEDWGKLFGAKNNATRVTTTMNAQLKALSQEIVNLRTPPTTNSKSSKKREQARLINKNVEQ